MADRPYAANRAAAVWSKAFAWAANAGLIPEGHNPAKGIKKFREQGRERFLTSEEVARLGDALREGETQLGFPIRSTQKPSRRRSTLQRPIIDAPSSTNMRRLPFGF